MVGQAEVAAPSGSSGAADPTPVGDLDLYELAWDRPGFAADPYPEFEAARRQHPWLAKVPGGIMVHDLAAIRDLLVQDDRLRTSFDGVVDIMEAHGTAWGRFAQEQMIAMPDREHRLLRDTFAAKFTPRNASQMRPIMRETMIDLLREWLPRRQIDFEEFASYYPVAVTARLFGASLDVIPVLRSSMETLGLAFSMNSAMLPRLDAAMAQLDAFAFDLIAERRANPRQGQSPDLLDLLIEAGNDDGISERILADLVIFLFVAGYDTSKNVLTYMMRLLIDRPDIYRRSAESLEYCGAVVEEALRMFTPAQTFRATREDMVYRGVLIPRDTMLFFALNVAGRVSADIDHPHAFDPDRKVNPKLRHVGFGLGKHMCLGQHIARAQLQEGLHLVAQGMRDPHAAGEPGWRPFPGVWGIDGLPIAFEPGEIAGAG